MVGCGDDRSFGDAAGQSYYSIWEIMRIGFGVNGEFGSYLGDLISSLSLEPLELMGN